MALNLDTALRVVAKVSGLNDFKALTEGLQGVEGASKNANSGLQQTANESQRVSQEAAKAASTVKVQATALQDLQAKTRASAAEMRRMGAETTGLGGVLQRLRGQSGGVFDGLSGSTVKAANNIRGLQQSIQPTEAQLAKLRGEMLQLGASSKTTERSLEQQIAALKNLRSQAELNGGVYQALSGDIAKLQAASKGLDATSTTAAGGLKRVAAASAESGDAIRQQIQSLTALQGSLKGAGVDMGATAQQVEALKRKAAELGQAWEPGIRGLKLLAQESAKSVEAQSGNMTRLQGVLSKAGEGYQRLGREIDNLRQKAAGLDLSKGINFTPAGVASGVGGAVRNIVQMRQDLSRSMMGRVVLTGEGLAATGVAGAAGMGAASGLGGMAGGAQAVAASLDAIAAKAAALPGVLKPLGGLLSEPAAAAAGGVAQWASALTSAQAKLQALATPFEAIGTAITSIGPEAAAAAGVASLAIAGVYQVLKSQADAAQADLEQSFQGISDAAQKVLTDLVRIYDKVPNARLEAQQQLRDRNLQRLGEVPSDSVEARRAANAVVTAEREITKIQGERAALLDNARQQQNQATEALKSQVAVARERLEAQRRLTAETKQTAAAEREARAIAGSIRRNQERLARDEQRLAPQREAEAAAAVRTQELLNAARQRLELQRQLTEEQKRTNAQLAEERAIRGSIRRNQERVAAEQARAAAADADLRRRAAEAFAPSRVLALPAAGQSSFQGAINAAGLGGGARARLQNFETAGTRDDIGAAMASRTAQALQQQTQATQRTRGALAELFVTIDRVTASSNGSISALQRQRSAWEALRLAVNPAAPAYAKATAEVKRLDEQLQKLTGTQQRAQQRGIGREAIGGALGTLATGGGVQGAVGALAGGLAFSGGPAGLAAGAAVAGGAALLGGGIQAGIASVDAERRLKSLAGAFGEVEAAQAAAARAAERFGISQTEADRSFAQIYARLRPVGITLEQIESAYNGFNTAARLSGTTATEASAAWLQLSQALGSGVLRGEELNSVFEQTPGVVQAIAKEMGIGVGQIRAYAKEGQITSDIVLRALKRIEVEGAAGLADAMGGPSQAIRDFQIAAERVSIALTKTAIPEIGRSLKELAVLIENLEGPIKSIGGLAATTLGTVNDLIRTATKPQEFAAEQAIRGGRLPLAGLGGISGAEQLFLGTSGSGGIGLTGLKREAEELARLRRQPVPDVLLELMQGRLARMDARNKPATALPASPTTATPLPGADKPDKAERERQQAAERLQRQELDYQNDLFNIRLNAERRLRDFREQSLERAKSMERDLADQRLELERRTDELTRQAAGQRQDFYLRLERSNLAAIGGDTSSLDIEIEATQALREASNQRIKNEQDATDRRVTLERAVENYKLTVAQSIRDILLDAGQQLADRMQQGAQGAAAALGRVSPGGVIARTGNTGDSTGPHLDGRWADRRPITVADLDRYIRVGGRTPSSFGVTSGYGPRRLFGRSFHAGVDVGTPNGTPITLTGGATFGRDLGNTGAGGYAVEIMTPEGPMRLLHLSANSVRRPSGAAGPVNGIRSIPSALRPATAMQPLDPSSVQTPGMEGINAAAAKLQQASDALRTASDRVAMNAPLDSLEARFGQITQGLGQQRQNSRSELEDFQRIIGLQRSGMSPDLARQSVERARMAEQEQTQLQTLENQTVQYLQQKDLTAEQRQQAQALLEATRQRAIDLPRITAELDLEAATLERLRDLEVDRQQLIDGISGTIGNGLTSAMDALISGTESWGDSLRTIGATVLRDIARQLAQIYLIQPATQGIQGLLGGLLGGGGAAAAAAAGGGLSPFTAPMLTGVPTISGTFANGGIMTPDGPLPLRTYARGGIASSPQLALFGEGRMPEAFVPLPDGRRIPVAMQGGGNGAIVNNVTVNVDASGSNVQGDSEQAQQLGREFEAAVQEVMLKQKRPGGILYR